MYKLVAVALIGIAIASSIGAGQPTGGDFTITESTIDGGGGTAAGGDFVLTGTVGQPDASTQVSTAGAFALAGGFWADLTSFVAELIFSDGFE